MDKKNKIDYSFDEKRNVVNLSGDLNNFPKITLIRGNSLFELSIKNKKILNYLPRSQNDSKGENIIGYHALKAFSKF